MKQKCFGCPKECVMDSSTVIRGCAYADGVYPKDAYIWYICDVINSPEKAERVRKLIKNRYPEAWEKENRPE